MTSLFSFQGRADRFEWWSVSLLSDLVCQAGLIFGGIMLWMEEPPRPLAAAGLFVVAATAFWAALAVAVRRFRDRGYPGWLLLAALIPVAGQIWFVVECGFLPARDSRRPRKLVRRHVTAEMKEAH